MTTWLSILFFLLGILLAIVAMSDLVRRLRSGGRRASSVLMNAAGISRADRRLLWQIARLAKLQNAGCLLLSRGCFEHAARAASERGIDRQAINDLQRRIAEQE